MIANEAGIGLELQTGLFLDSRGDRLLKILSRQFRADEQFLSGPRAQGDGFPAVRCWDSDAHRRNAFSIAHRTDYAGNYGTDGTIGEQSFKDRAQSVYDAVLYF
jgi:hypothetical protein